MAVQIRLSRFGRTNLPYYRVVAIDERHHREGRSCEVLGLYDPLLPERNIQVDIERVHAWLGQGAQYSESVASLLKRGGYQLFPEGWAERKAQQAAKRKAKRQGRQKKQPNAKALPNRRALRKHQARLKAERLAQAAAQQPKAAAAEAPAEQASGATGEA